MPPGSPHRAAEALDRDDFVRIVVPASQERGIHKGADGGGTLRNKLFGRGDRLDETNAGGYARRRAQAPA